MCAVNDTSMGSGFVTLFEVSKSKMSCDVKYSGKKGVETVKNNKERVVLKRNDNNNNNLVVKKLFPVRKRLKSEKNLSLCQIH